MSETRIVDIIEFLDKSSRVINLKIRLRMTALQFGIRHISVERFALKPNWFPDVHKYSSHLSNKINSNTLDKEFYIATGL